MIPLHVISSRILRPIIRQFPLFCMYLILMGSIVVRRLHGKTVSPLQYPDISYFDIIISTTVVFLFAYCLSWLLSNYGKKWLKIVLYVITIGLFSIDFFLIQNFKMFISPNLLMLLGETNRNESTEFIQTFMGIKENIFVYGVVIAAILSSILFEYIYPKLLSRLRHTWLASKRMKQVIAGGVTVLLISGICCSATYIRMLGCNDTDDLSKWETSDKTYPHDPLSNTFYAFYGIHLAKKEISTALETTAHIDNEVITKTDSATVVFVIGESYIKSHAGLYGYTLNTTPSLCKEKNNGNLYVFNDVCAPFNLTSYAMKNMLCSNSLSDNEAWYESPFIPAIFKKAGFDVLMWDNQKDDSPGASWAFALNSFLYDKRISRFYTACNKHSFPYDKDIVEDYIKQNKAWKGHSQFAIIHLMGQHSAAGCRYPQEETHFTADSIKRNEAYLTKEKKEKIAQYDNATLYNDHVLEDIINYYSDQNVALVYLSDHGDEMYDYRDFEGRRGDNNVNANLLRYQYGVPFMIWCSLKYQELHPETMEAIKRAVDKPFMTDNVCQVLFHLGGIQSRYYKPERDPLTDQYRKPRRLVNRTIDYDAFVHR